MDTGRVKSTTFHYCGENVPDFPLFFIDKENYVMLPAFLTDEKRCRISEYLQPTYH